MRIKAIRPMYVESFPNMLEEGVIYISRRFRTACHLCCCGCGTKIVTPLRQTEYSLTDNNGRISLYPSVGNWNHSCRSHYVIRHGQAIPAGNMAQADIDLGRARDEAEKRTYYGQKAPSGFKGLLSWIKVTVRPLPH